MLMNNWNDKLAGFFFCFLKISVTIALAAILIASTGVVAVNKIDAFDINLIVLLTTSLFLCILIALLRLKPIYKVILILAVAFVVRLIWTIKVNSVPVSDFLTIYESAKAFLSGNKGALRDYGYLARFPHLVPMMVYMMGMIKLFGPYHIIAIKGVALSLSVLNVYLVYVLSSYYVKKPFARYAAMIIAAIYPSFISYSSTFCTETIGVTLFLSSMILFNKANLAETKKFLWFFLCGCVLYLSNMFRAVGIIFLIAFGMYIFIFSKKQKILNFASLLAGYMIVAVLVSSVLIGIGVIEQPLWKGKEPSFATLMLKGSNFEHKGTWNVEDAKFVDKYLKSDNLSEKCFEVIKERLSEKNIPEIATFYFGKFFSQWTIGDCSGTYWATFNTDVPFKYPLPYIFQVIYTLVILAAVFIFISKRDNNTSLALPLILLCGFGIVFMLIETQGRYSYVVSWIFILLASVGIENLVEFYKKQTVFSNLYRKYKSEIMYIIFGVVTTISNILVYALCYDLLHITNVISTIIAWIISVLVAYITNKLWVFESKSFSGSVLIKEVPAFMSCRIITGIIDIIIMFVSVDVLCWNSTLMKIASNVIVILLNYLASKLYIFKSNE